MQPTCEVPGRDANGIEFGADATRDDSPVPAGRPVEPDSVRVFRPHKGGA